MSETRRILSIGAALLMVGSIAGSSQEERVLARPDTLGQDKSAYRQFTPVLASSSDFSIFYEQDMEQEDGDLVGEELFFYHEEDHTPSLFDFFFHDEEEQEWLEEELSDTVQSITPSFGGVIRRMKARNSDTVGWLQVPGTDINQVVVQTPAHLTNDYYLNVNFDGVPDRNGTYCVDRRAKFGSGYRSDLSRITAIYGHSWDDNPQGDLFAQLKQYRDEDFAREHPYIYFSTASEDLVWEVFAVFETPTDLLYNVPNLNSNYFFDMLDIVEQASLYHYDTAVGAEDKILTLSTCIFSVQGHEVLPAVNYYRFAIMARLVEPEEKRKEEAVLSVNSSPIAPDTIKALINNGAIRDYDYTASKY